MKKALTFMLMVAAIMAANAQIVITEIMYNPPESGGDLNEYVELYNNGNDAIDMSGYSFTEGVDYTFGSFVLEPNSYVLVAKDSVELNTNFGVAAFQWTGGALSNGGEDIVIVDAGGITQDSVDYDDGNGWPESPDGDGFSLVLCDYSSDNNDPASWQAASTDTGVSINDKEVFANPGAASECQAETLVRFITFGEEVGEATGSVMVGVEYPAGDFVAWQVMVALDLDASTATNGMDFSFVDTTLELSGFNELDTAWLEIPIIDDDTAEDTESIVLNMTATNIGVNVAFDTYTIDIIDDDTNTDIPSYPIGLISTVDANGVADSLGVLCKVQGVVYGVNLNAGGLQFTIIDDNNDGLGLYLNNGDLGYTVQEGDEVIVQGTISQYNGLTQIYPESVELVSQANALVDPAIVTVLDETTESQLVKIENVTIVDPAQWGSGTNGFNVVVTDGINQYAMRIDNDVDIFTSEVGPTQAFHLTGIGGQYDSSEPYDEGYQILPRSWDDIEILEAVKEPWPSDIRLFPNPTKGALNIQMGEKIDRLVIRDVLGITVFVQSDVQSNASISLSDLPVGVYIISIQRGNQLWARKVTKM